MPISTSGLSVPQLGQQFDTSMYGNAPTSKQDLPKSMTISDMLDISKKQLDLNKAKETYEPEVTAVKARSRQAETEATKAKLGLDTSFADKMRQQQIALINHPLIVQAEQDPAFAKAHADEIHKLVLGQKDAAIELGLDPNKAESLNAPYHTVIDSTGGQGLRQYLKTRMVAGLDQSAQAALQPNQYFQAAPNVAPTSSQPSSNDPYSKPEGQVYPTPQAGQPRAQNPQEEVDRNFGAQYRTGLKQVQQAYPAIRQNYDKLIDQAELIAGGTFFGGAAGTAERSLKAKIGTPEYQQLSKDLANAQIAQIQATGGSLDTVAGQNLTAHANGSVIYDPKVLIDIARRNAANLENSYGQSFGADKASEKFGDANVNRKFRTEWNKNANDNSVFEMQYIFNRAKTPEEGAANVARYIKESGLSAEKRKELATKYLNLQKLRNEGSL